jgi:FAD/FMN-containing dehydrogenase
MIQDAVVPRSRLPEILQTIYGIASKYNLVVANVFHAGDGNLHPLVCFDSRSKDEVERVKEAGREIMEACVNVGGSITGEHGVGFDKKDYLPLIFSDDDMDLMMRVRAAFDPSGLCNPGKIIPTPRGCGEARAISSVPFRVRTELHTLASEIESIIATHSPDDGRTLKGTLHSSNQSWHRLQSVDSTREIVTSKDDRTLKSMLRQIRQIVGEENVEESKHVENAIIATPGSIEEACELLQLASAEKLAVVPAGACTWLDVGNPMSRVDLVISTKRLNQIIEHEPADLVASTQAGVTLDQFNSTLAQNGQWLPLDPSNDGSATIGGVVATGLAGAHRIGYGAPRNFVIGMRVALADGRIIKAGGRVVKNVAGYDLCKLFTGSYGTLGLILELTFKLRPLPSRTTTVFASGVLDSLLTSANVINNSRLFPVALEIHSKGAASIADYESEDLALLVRFAGNESAVAFQIERAKEILSETSKFVAIREDDDDIWRGVSTMAIAGSDRFVLRCSVRVSDLKVFIAGSLSTFERAGFDSVDWQAGAADGRVRFAVVLNHDTAHAILAIEKIRQIAGSLGGSVVIEDAPREFKERIDAWGEIGSCSSLMNRIKMQLDPMNSFSPERFCFSA